MLPNLQYWKLMLKCVKETGNNVQIPNSKGTSTKELLLKNLLSKFKTKFTI